MSNAYLPIRSVLLTRCRWRAIRWPVVILAVLLALFTWAWLDGYRINLSPSEPVGIWHMQAVTSLIRPGEFVSFCAPTPDFPFLQSGNCPNGVAPFLKEVVGVPGDVITETASGVTVNGELLPDSRPLAKAMGYDIALPQWRGTLRLAEGQYWTYGSGWPKLSFDSRYWGPLPGSRIIHIAQPIWVWRQHIWLP